MANDEKIKHDWELLDNADIDEVCHLLRLHEHRIQDYLVDIVSATCDVDKFDMMKDTGQLNNIHARWLFWYAYRYMTNDTFVKIATVTERYGKRFTEQSISNSVNKMGNMITQETIWTKRWTIIRHIIKLRDESKSKDENQIIKVTVVHPKGVDVKLQLNNE